MIRGTTDGANCEQCPFSAHGQPRQPLRSIFPDEGRPTWIAVGEGPGHLEAMLGRHMAGGPGELFMLGLKRVRVQPENIAICKSYLCKAFDGATEADKDRAALACSTRLKLELAQFPQVPILTLGALAARAVIPAAAFAAIDPDDAPTDRPKGQKSRDESPAQAAARKAAKAARKLDKTFAKHMARIKILRKQQLKAQCIKLYKRKPDKRWFEARFEEDEPGMRRQAADEAAAEIAEEARLKAAKPKAKKKVKIGDLYSTTFEVDVDGTGARYVIPAVHPGTLLKGGGRSIGGSHTPDLGFVNLIYDISKIQQLGLGADLCPKFSTAIEFTTGAEASALVRDICLRAFEEGTLALDLETYVEDPTRHTALMPLFAQIRAMGLAVGDRAISVIWGLVDDVGQALLRAVLASEAVAKVYHNGLYDRTVLIARGFDLRGPWEDTLLAHHAAFPGVSHRLQQVAAQFFAIAPWKSEFRNAEESPEGLTTYNAKDTGTTLALWKPLAIHVKRTATERVYALDKTMSEIATRMHLVGVPIDRATNQELLTEFSGNIDRTRAAIEQLAYDPKVLTQIIHHLAVQQAVKRRKGESDLIEERYDVRRQQIEDAIMRGGWRWKLGASKHVAAFLLSLGVSLTQVTKGGDLATKKDVLEGLVAAHPIVRDLIGHRENSTLLKNFVLRIFDRTDEWGGVEPGFADHDDRIHPVWSVHKITGRWASTMPGTSNVPKDKWKKQADGTSLRIRPNLRRQVRARRGKVLVGFDFSQLEARIIGLISGDEFLCRTFAEGKDIHTECARIIFGASFDNANPTERKALRELTKPLEYGAFYGGSVETLWKQLLKDGRNVTLADIDHAIGRLKAGMPGVTAWQQSAVATALAPPYEIRDFLLGRRRTFPTGNVEPTEAMNFGVQSAGSAIMNTGMSALWCRLQKDVYQAEPLLQIHDACVFEVDEDQAPLFAHLDVEDAFTQRYERNGIVVPFPIEVKIGETWGDV